MSGWKIVLTGGNWSSQATCTAIAWWILSRAQELAAEKLAEEYAQDETTDKRGEPC